VQSSSLDNVAAVAAPTPRPGLRLLLLPLVILAGMGLSVDAGLLGPLGVPVGHLLAPLRIFGGCAASLGRLGPSGRRREPQP